MPAHRSALSPHTVRDTVIFDFGGVITTSPFAAFARFERTRDLPAGTLRRINAVDPDRNAWARFERAEIDAIAFDDAFAAEARALGVDVRGREVLALLAGDVRPRMVAALDWLRRHDFTIGCITNNVPSGIGGAPAKADEIAAILARFAHVVESSKVGVRKPDPAIYRMMLDALGKDAAACVYLDDLGINCKPAATLGMAAIKVVDEAQALDDLADAIGVDRGQF